MRSKVPIAALASVALLAPALRAQHQGVPTPEQVRANAIAALLHDARDWNEKYRLPAWERLLTEFGDDGRKALLPIVTARLAQDRKAVEAQYQGALLARSRKHVEAELVARRKEALAFIFDPSRYPDENHGAAGQPEVNRLVALVTEAWEHPAFFARRTEPDVETAVRLLEDDLVYLEACGGKPSDDMPTVAAWIARFDAGFERDALGISDSQRRWNDEVAKYHAEELLTTAEPEELACMNATNDYRRMMGVRLLEIDEHLVRAARKHSQEMNDLHYFDHASPIPENASPGLRCAHEGHPGGGAENIAGGMNRGEDAFRGWYTSSGHHRNMLGGHQQIGVGRCDQLWTQNFGGGSSLRGRKIEDPQLLYLGKLKKLDEKNADAELALALWCRQHRLDEPARLHAERALALDPKNEKVRALLDEIAAGPAPAPRKD